MNDNRKIYFHIDSHTSMEKIFEVLDTVQSNNEDKIEELIDVFDT